jgi:hypothetical protein
MPKQPVRLSDVVCGCGDPLSAHTKRVVEGQAATACSVEDCACTAFVPETEMQGDAPYSMSPDQIVRSAGLDPDDPRVKHPVQPAPLKAAAAPSENGETETAAPRAKRQRGPDPDKERAKEERYGPLRAIKKVTSTTAAGKRVIFECGHAGSAGAAAQRARCRVCRDAGKTTTTTKRTPVAVESKSAERRKTIQREPVKSPVAKTPVKSGRRRPEKKSKK